MIAAAQRFRPANPPARHGKKRQDNERPRHRTRRFVDVVFHIVRHARFAVKRQEHQPEHVKRGHPRGHEADPPEHRPRIERGRQDRVFAHESSQWRNSRNGDRRHQKRSRGRRDFLCQRAHLAHVLFPAERVDHAARTEKEQGLEEGMGHQVENSRRKRAYPQRQEHVTKLADGRISQHAFDIVLHQTHARRVNRGHRADRGHRAQSDGRELKDHVHPRDHIDAGRHHGRRVNQRAHRRRPFHRVRQPNVKRNLRRLSGCAHKKQQRDRRHYPVAHRKSARLDCRADLREAQRANRVEQQEEPQDESRISDAVHHEGLLPRIRRRSPQEIKSDQQITAKPHAFPADEEQEQIIRQDQNQHGKHEQVHVAEEAVVASFVRHIADGIDVDEKTDAGHDPDHHRRKRVQQHAPGRVEVQHASGHRVHHAGGNPVEEHNLH